MKMTPNLTVADGLAAIAWYASVFGAVIERKYEFAGKLMHSELRLGETEFSVSEAYPEYGLEAPTVDGPVQCAFCIWVEDADAVFARAIEAGAREASPVALAFSGQRMGAVRDPFGHRWVIATEVEHLSEQEIQRRMEDAMSVDIA